MSFSTGKRIVITGANSGIGLETARNLSYDAGELILICRNRERGETAVKDILSSNDNANISLITADLSSPSSIVEAVDHLKKKYESIDILINNAGGIFFTRMETSDGLEYTFGLNHMGYFRMTEGLLPLMKISADARIINVASAAHRYSPLDFSDLQHEKKYQGFRVYSRSKLANILFTRELAKRISNTKITAVSLHPGFIRSNFAGSTNRTAGGGLFRAFARIAGKSPAVGAETPTYLAQSDTVVHGGYYSNKQLSKPSVYALDDEAALRLWAISDELSQMNSI